MIIMITTFIGGNQMQPTLQSLQPVSVIVNSSDQIVQMTQDS